MPHPGLHAIQPTATLTAVLHCAFALRGLVLLVMVAIVLQALVSPGLRIAARTHFHLDSTLAQKQDTGEVQGHPQADTDADAQSHSHPHAHSHTHLATHEHAGERNDVVYVDTQNSELPSGHASKRVVLDLDGLLLRREPPSVDMQSHVVFAELALSFRSRIEPPLERPPRIGS